MKGLTAEQVRIGQSLYDGICQELASASFACEILQRKLAGAEPRGTEEVRRIGDLVCRAMIQARDTARLLQPVKTQPDGLVHALLGLAASVSERHGVGCTFECEGMVLVHDDIIATFLYRIAEQIVEMAIGQRGARNAEIELSLSGPHLCLGVTYDVRRCGSGGQAARQIGPTAHLARIIGASLKTRQVSRRQMRVTCLVPKMRPKGRVLAETEGYHGPNQSRKRQDGCQGRRGDARGWQHDADDENAEPQRPPLANPDR